MSEQILKKLESMEWDKINNIVDTLQIANKAVFESEQEAKVMSVRLIATLLQENIEILLNAQEQILTNHITEMANENSKDFKERMEFIKNINKKISEAFEEEQDFHKEFEAELDQEMNSISKKYLR